MLLSDRDIRAELEAGRVKIDPYDPSMIQPSSVDVRLDRLFRVFENHKYPHIDPAIEQPELTRLVEVGGDEAFVLHPGEFVLASTYELFGLPGDLAARLEGKALDVDTPVPTPDGWRTMGSLRVGDQVFDEKGRPTYVIAATDFMYGRECRKVVFSDGSALVADLEHQWVTTSKSERDHGRRDSFVRTTREIERTVRCRGELNHQVALAEAVQYPEQELPVDPYVLGVWLGDGTASKAEIAVGAGDEQTLREAAGFAAWSTDSRRAFRGGGLSLASVGGERDRNGRHSGSLSGTLTSAGEHVPDVYLRGSIGQRLALLQGLMDSDGDVDVRGRCEFVNKSEALSDAVHELAAGLGLRPVKRTKRVTLDGRDTGLAYQVKFTPHFPVFRLERKLRRLKQTGFQGRSRGISGVERVPSRPVRCIQVLAPSGQFLAGRSFIPTHNSSLGRLGLLTHSTAGWIDPGFSGHVTLELSNVATLPIKLWPGMKIGQMCLFRTSSPAEHPYGSEKYGSRYQDQRGPTPSRSYLNFHQTKV